MARKGKHKGGDDHGGGGHGGASGRWLVSYADFVTLMFVVFVVLFAMARVDAGKYSGLAQSLHDSFGSAKPNPGIPPLPVQEQSGIPIPVKPNQNGQTPGPGGPADGQPPKDPPPKPPDWAVVIVDPPAPAQPDPKPNPKPDPTPSNEPPPKPPDPLTTLKEAFEGLPGARSGLMAVALQERGLVISVAGTVLFEPGKTTLRSDAHPVLDSIAAKLAGVTTPLMVEGTGDPTPPPNISQWDLASLRAGSVVQYFVSNKGLDGGSFVVIGHGGNTGGQGSDQRVSIVVMRKAN